MTAPAARTRYLASAACVGAALALIGYRFGALPLDWQSKAEFLFPALAGSLAVLPRALLKGLGGSRPSVALLAGAAVGAAALVATASFFMVPPLGHLRLTTRQLPGFSVGLPGDLDAAQYAYDLGQVRLTRVGGTGGTVAVAWQPGPMSPEELEVAARALGSAVGAAADGGVSLTALEGPDGASVPLAIVHSDKGPIQLSGLPCGGRTLMLTSMGGAGMEALHRRIMASFHCEPDLAQEASLARPLPLVLDLPGWHLVDPAPGQWTLSDDVSSVLVRPLQGTAADSLEKLVGPLLAAGGMVDVVTSPPEDGCIPLRGTMDGDALHGWARGVTCGDRMVVLFSLSPDAAHAHALLGPMRGARCLGEGETPAEWPRAAP